MGPSTGLSPDKTQLSRNQRVLLIAALTLPALLGVGLREGHQWVTALLWSGIFLMMGALVGFIFAVPNVHTEAGNGETRSVRVNSNLEQICDWITKVLVGVFLINLKDIPPQLNKLSGFMVGGLAHDEDRAFVLALILYFSCAGFLIAYFATHIYLRLLSTEEGAKALEALSRTMESTLTKQIASVLRAPTLVNYKGFLCLQVSDEQGGVLANGRVISVKDGTGTLRLETWLQGERGPDSGVMVEPVSIVGGEPKGEAEFEIRIDSEAVSFERTSEFVTTKGGERTQTVEFRGTFDGLRAERSGYVEFDLANRTPENPIWLMLFQHNRLIQTIALDLTTRY